VPAKVMQALKAKYPKAEVLTAGKGDQDGTKVYEFELKEGGSKWEAAFTPDAKFAGSEEVIKEAAVPAPVGRAFHAKYPGANVEEIEKAITVENNAEKVVYEFNMKTASGKLEAVFDPTGKLLGSEAVVPEEATKGDEKVPLAQVPGPVMATAKSKYPGAKVIAAVKEGADGKTTYEVTLKDKADSIDLVIRPDGTLVAIEKLIDAKGLPKEVAGAINAKYPGATIKKAEEVTEGNVISYEVGLTTADKKSVGLTLDPNGKILEVE